MHILFAQGIAAANIRPHGNAESRMRLRDYERLRILRKCSRIGGTHWLLHQKLEQIGTLEHLIDNYVKFGSIELPAVAK